MRTKFIDREYIHRENVSAREQLADDLWNTGQKIIELEFALKNNERRFGKSNPLTKDTRARLKAAKAEKARLSKLMDTTF